MTSVKEFRVAEPATASSLGRGRFVFTDAYSVFDWGQMPDDIPRKGASLCVMGASNFERLAAADVPTHYRGVVDPTAVEAGTAPESAVVPLTEARAPPTEMAIELTQVPDLPYQGPEAGYDYEAYHAAGEGTYLIPLEVVFRNTVPVGSSLRRRTTPADVGLEATEWPAEPVSLPEPVVEFSTKYEEQDRYLSRAEADAIAGRADVASLEALARRVNRIVTDRAEATGFTHHDGKIECLYHEGELRVADVVGTFDENRFARNGRGVSKEVVRQWYKRNDPTWVDAVSRAKTDVTNRDIDDWRTLCTETPDSLPGAVLDAVSTMYAAGANAYTERAWFDAPPIDEALQTIEQVVD
jgi:phosphoribosylaminoimidazole-succinocarboxamide synthase